MPDLNLNLTTIPGIILATPTGLGAQVLMEPLGEDPLFTYSLWEILESSLGELVVVLPEDDGELERSIRQWFPGTRLGFAYFQMSSAGEGPQRRSSIARALEAGLEALPSVPTPSHAPEAVMILRADMPFVATETINTLISIHQSVPEPRVLLPSWATSNLPALLTRELVRELISRWGSLTGPDVEARALPFPAELALKVRAGQSGQSLCVVTPTDLEEAQKTLALKDE